MVIWIIHICTFDYIPSTLVFYVSLSISFYRADFFYCALFYPNLGAYKLPIFRTQSHTWRFVWRTFFLFLSSLNPKMRAALNCFITCNYRFKKKKNNKNANPDNIFASLSISIINCITHLNWRLPVWQSAHKTILHKHHQSNQSSIHLIHVTRVHFVAVFFPHRKIVCVFFFLVLYSNIKIHLFQQQMAVSQSNIDWFYVWECVINVCVSK